MWPQENVHNLFACRISGCFCLSGKNRSDFELQKMPKKRKTRNPTSINTNGCWIHTTGPFAIWKTMDFFCVLCKKHNMKNAQNKSQTFIESPSKRLKEDSLKTHMASTVHSSAIQADLLQRMCFSSKLRRKKWSSDNGSSECVFHCFLSYERIHC